MPDTIEQYREDLRQLVHLHGYEAEAKKITSFDHSKHKRVLGLLLADSLFLGDGGILKFQEQIEIVDGKVIRYKYSYGYTSADREFRYDKDPIAANDLDHPLCHLHVSGHANIRYRTHESTFSEVFEFILASSLK